MKKLLICLTLGAIVVVGGARVQASSSAATMTVKWNNNYSVTVAFQGNYTSSGTSGSLSPSSASFIAITNSGSGQCNGGGGSSGITAGGAGTTSLTMDFGNIKPDASVTTICILLNAVEASVTTADPAGANILVQMTSAPATAGVSLCYVPIANNAPKAISSTVSSSQLTAAKAQDTTDTTGSLWTDPTQNCSGLKYNGAAVAGATAFSASQTGFLNSSDDTTNPAYFGADYALIFPALSSGGSSDSATITYTVTSN